MIRLMLGQPYQRPSIEALLKFIEEQIMWEMAHRRKDFDLIRTNCVDEEQYALIQNFIRHRDMPFGLPMPSSQAVFGSIA